MKPPIRIVIIEDNKAYARSLETLLEFNERAEHLATFANAEICLSEFESLEKSADIVLLDLNLPGKNGLSLIPFFKAQNPSPKILVLTQNDNYQTTLEALRLGVSGYILKDAEIQEIEYAIQEVFEGGCVIDPKLSRLVLNALENTSASAQNPLSDRERQVLELHALGYVKKEIAEQLDLSYHTVVEYTQNIYKKLNVPNIAAAIATAIRKGLI